MRILVVGGGGREHAIAWALSKSPQTPELLVAPGNPGTAELAENVPVAADDIEGLAELAVERKVDLCVVGPEIPLVAGLVDRLDQSGIPAMGPTAAAAKLEGSKAFAKAFMQRHGIPTAGYRTFGPGEFEAALAYVRNEGAPTVVKASGLAAGKGAVVCETLSQAESVLRDMMLGAAFGDAGSEVVIEEFMEGEEASLFAICDGQDYVLLHSAQDHKRIGEGDTGPNTGGMGAYCPAPVVTDTLLATACSAIIEPTLAGMSQEGAPYRGVLYVGLMITPGGPKVVEYNCRLGDPETQVVLPMLESDLVELFMATATGGLADLQVKLASGSAACVVLASEGYPGAYVKGRPIHGVEQATALPDVHVFQAGTASDPSYGHRALATAGGRVLCVSARAGDLGGALDRAYGAVEKITFEGVQFRRDIGQKGLVQAGAE